MDKALPFDIADLEFRYGMSHVHLSVADAEDCAVRWWVEAVLPDENGGVIDKVGHAYVLMLDLEDALDAGEDPFDVLDSLDGDVSAIGAEILEIGTGSLDPELGDRLAMPFGTVAILDQVWVDPRFRGHGIGPLLGATALWTFRRGCCVMACYPAPFEDRERVTEEEHRLAVDALGRVWAKVGFEPFRVGVWIMDPADVKQRDARQLLLRNE